jgi:predicted aldo/keto reductase-like oxidoreductase
MHDGEIHQNTQTDASGCRPSPPTPQHFNIEQILSLFPLQIRRKHLDDVLVHSAGTYFPLLLFTDRSKHTDRQIVRCCATRKGKNSNNKMCYSAGEEVDEPDERETWK